MRAAEDGSWKDCDEESFCTDGAVEALDATGNRVYDSGQATIQALFDAVIDRRAHTGSFSRQRKRDVDRLAYARGSKVRASICEDLPSRERDGAGPRSCFPLVGQFGFGGRPILAALHFVTTRIFPLPAKAGVWGAVGRHATLFVAFASGRGFDIVLTIAAHNIATA